VKLILGLDEEPSNSHIADAYAVAISHALGSPLVGAQR
jgi:Holliday junction resolvasome RuvABC endonuclease subunit